MRMMMRKLLNSLGVALGVLAVFFGPLTAQAQIQGRLPEPMTWVPVVYIVIVVLLILAFGLLYLGTHIGSAGNE